MSAARLARVRVSLKMVEVCSPARMDLTEGISASWPVTTGRGFLAVP
jgi:hypothetical protein